MSAQKKIVAFKDEVSMEWLFNRKPGDEMSLLEVADRFVQMDSPEFVEIRLKVERSYIYSDVDFYLVGKRMETQVEADARELREVKALQAAEKKMSIKMAKLKMQLAELTADEREELLR